MQPLRLYLLVRQDENWLTTVYKDFDELLISWQIFKGRADVTVFIHAGLTRKNNNYYEDIAVRFAGRVLLTASARWILHDYGKYAIVNVPEINEPPVYVALDGWGYTADLASLGLNSEQTASNSEVKSNPANQNSIWINSLENDNPLLFEITKNNGINDDESYLRLEKSLSTEIRKDLAAYRFKILSGPEELDEPIKILKYVPPWFLELKLEQLGLSVRAYNCLKSVGIENVNGLVNLTKDDLLKIDKFGKTTLLNLTDSLLKVLNQHSILLTKYGNSSSLNTFGVSYSNAGKIELATFNSSLKDILIKLDGSKLSEILKFRMGYGCDPMTLQEVGDVFNFTRERSRQIEAKAVKKLYTHPFWRDDLEARLIKLISDRDDSLTFSGLEVLDPWFADIKKLQAPFKYILDKFLDGRFNLIKANGQVFISRINQEEWDRVCRHAIKYIESGINSWTFADAKSRIAELLPLRANELRHELWEVIGRFTHFSFTDNGQQILVGVGRSTEMLIEAVLADSPFPLHFTEITKKVREKFGKSIDDRTIHNATRDRAYRFGPGTYGLLKHLPLCTEELEQIKARCENIIINDSKTRQWSCAELLEHLESEGLDFEGRVNIYVVNIALSTSEKLSYLRRMIWAQAGDVDLGSAHRVDLAQAVETLLLNAGRPMTTNEIKEIIQKDRGLGETFQIHPAGSVIRVGTGQWGLIERDSPLNSQEQLELIKILESILIKTNEGIHITEVKSLVLQQSNIGSNLDDPTLFFTLAQKSGKMRLSRNGYLYLPEWGESRRISPSEAIHRVLLDAPPEGLSSNEVATRASNYLRRPVKREIIYAPMLALGARYDESTGRWHLPIETEIEVDELES